MNIKNKKDILPIVLYIIVFFGIQLIAGIYLGLSHNGSSSTISDKTLSLINIISYLAIFIVLVIIYHKKLIEDYKRISKKDIKHIAIYTVILIVLNFLISNLFAKLDVEMQNQDAVLNLLNNYKVLMIISIVLFAPVTEEIVYRYSINTLINNKILFIIVSSIIFGAMHGLGVVTTLYILMGIILSLCYLKTDNNIISSIIIHILNNISGVLTIIILFR